MPFALFGIYVSICDLPRVLSRSCILKKTQLAKLTWERRWLIVVFMQLNGKTHLVGGNEAWSEIIQMIFYSSNEWSRTRQHSPQLWEKERFIQLLWYHWFANALFLNGPLYVWMWEDELRVSFCGSHDILSHFLHLALHKQDFKPI